MHKTRNNKQQKKQPKNLTICRGRYALCTSAPCKPLKNKPGKTNCKCKVQNGYNFATRPCKTLKAHKTKTGTRRIYSTFSINELHNGKRITECPKNAEWSNCLNHKCVIDPKNPKKANCECTLRKSNNSWFTMGAKNHHKYCEESKWSGAHKKDFYATRKFWNSYFADKAHNDDKMIGNPKNIINKLK